MLTLSCPYVGPILPLCWPYLGLRLPQRVIKFTRSKLNTVNTSFFPFRGAPWNSKPRKTRGFLIVPRWISATPRATKHRKTRCFSTPRTKNTVIYRGSGGSEVTPRWAPWCRRQGRHATITFGQPKASGKGTDALVGLWGRRPLALSCPYVWPILLCWPYVGLSWPYLAPMLTLSCPNLTQCWPKLALSCPYVGPILPLCWPYLGPMLPHHVDKFGRTMFKHLQLVILQLFQSYVNLC